MIETFEISEILGCDQSFYGNDKNFFILNFTNFLFSDVILNDIILLSGGIQRNA